MNYDLKTQLKNLNAIGPDPVFVARTRVTLLKHMHKEEAPKFAWRSFAFLAPAFAAVVIVLGSLYQYFSAPVTVSAFDAQSITQEFNASVGAPLDDLTNSQTVNQTITSAITEISDTKTPHLSPTLLQSEMQYASLDSTGTSTDNVDSLLNQVIQ